MLLRRNLRDVLRVVRAHGIRGTFRRVRYGPSPVRLHIEAPLDNGYILGSVAVRGWAFSMAGDIVRVDAIHRGRVVAVMQHGMARADVSDHFGLRNALYSGFEGRFELPSGNQTVMIRATDDAGNTAVTRLRMDCDTYPPPQLVIEHAVWQSGRLSVVGWSLWVQSQPPRIVSLMRDGVTLGTARCDLSRPDISRRYTPEIAAVCRGFAVTLDISEIADGTLLQVTLSERGGHVLTETVEVKRLAGESHNRQAQLEAVVALVRAALDPDPSLLDWGAYVGVLPGCAVFSPPVDAPTLPSLDASVSIVAIADTARMAEARRIARDVVVTVGTPFTVEWLAGHAPTLPSVSIIVPTYNNAALLRTCLDALLQTLPAAFSGEIIVADDASTDDTPAMVEAYAARWPLVRSVRGDSNGGFVENCNRAAAAATGEYLVFLNNDALLQAGWLDALLMTFRQHPNAGIVGGRLLNPDGTLQDAGGIVVPDGTTAVFGADDPAAGHPLYRHVRSVDYCTGALLMTPRALFERIGGFDRRFAPAYYEDVDYGFAVRAFGYEVLYQPESVAVHDAHSSYGDFLARVADNRAVLIAKWRDLLARLPLLDANPYINVDRLRRPRVLVYGNRMPEFDRFGGLLRVHHLINALVDAGWNVTFYARDITGGERYANLLRQRGVMVFGGDLSHGVADEYLPDPVPLLKAARFDLAVLSLWQTAEPIIPLLREHSPQTRIIVDSSDVHFVREARARYAEGAVLDGIFARSFTGELNVYAAADAVLAVSQDEADIVNALLGRPGHAQAIPNMVELSPSPHPFSARRGMLFVGSYAYPPNLEAVMWLLREVLPLLPPSLLAEHPLSLIGHGAHEALGDTVRGMAHVQLLGWVPDVRLSMQRSRIAVVPLRNGAGTKTKLITALANRTPAVSTWIGAEGLGVRHEHDILIADTPAAFAAAVERLLTDELLWNDLAAAGFAHIEATHGYAVGSERFATLTKTLVGRLGSGG